MRSREGWTKIAESGPIKLKRKTYKNLVEYRRPCATCTEPFSIFVTAIVADERADSNNFGLRNCELHRHNKVTGGAVEEKTQMANSVMKAELDGCYATIRDLKARLAPLELRAAMERQASSPPSPKDKMPWN